MNELESITIEQIRKNAPHDASHYMYLFGDIKYLKKTDKPTFMTSVVQFVFRIKPL